APRDERERVERARALAERRSFAESLAGPTGGRVLVAPLLRPAPEAPAAAESARSAAAKPLVPLERGRVTARELAALRHRVDEDLRAGDEEHLTALALELAAAPDEGAATLALKVLETGPPEARLAALDGFARNKSPKVHELLARELRARPDAERALLVARALAAAPGPEATRALADEVARRGGDGDVGRVLLAALADRPTEELAPIATEVALAAR